MREIEKLDKALTEAGILHERRITRSGNEQIVVYDSEGNAEWDAIYGEGTYGHDDGLLEVMGCIVKEDYSDDVEGWLSADEIMKRVKETMTKSAPEPKPKLKTMREVVLEVLLEKFPNADIDGLCPHQFFGLETMHLKCAIEDYPCTYCWGRPAPAEYQDKENRP